MYRDEFPSKLAMHLRRAVLLAAALAAALGGVGCKAKAEPVGRLEAGATTISLAYPECTTIALTWRPTTALAGLRGHPRVFVHLLRPGRTLVRTFDHDLPRPWVPDIAQTDDADLCQSALAEPLAAGTYDLTVGLYDDASGARFPLVVGGDEFGPSEYRVAAVDVPMERSNVPGFDFSSGWGPLAGGADKQVLARRWLFGSGALRLTAVDAPGVARLALRVPEPGPIRVRVSSTCVQGWGVTLGPGPSILRAPVGGGLPDGTCELHFAPEFPSGIQPGSRSVGIENLAWIPSASK
ncbi:MAG: hypothetical protein ACHQQS_10470 [Thermoanaerobaculales bacterium]